MYNSSSDSSSGCPGTNVPHDEVRVYALFLPAVGPFFSVLFTRCGSALFSSFHPLWVRSFYFRDHSSRRSGRRSVITSVLDLRLLGLGINNPPFLSLSLLASCRRDHPIVHLGHVHRVC